jgi:predicted porin
MKTKLLAVMATLGMVASASAVKINNNISINGFIDGSYVTTDNDNTNRDDSNLQLDEVELNILVNAGNVSGELHIDTEDELLGTGVDDNDTHLSIEQVHFSYAFGNGASLQVGRFGSELGLEREDPAGLYTYSRAYNNEFDLGNVDSYLQEGARLAYSTGAFAGSVALYNAIGDIEDNNGSKNDLDYEVALSYTGFDNLTIGAGIQTVRPTDGNNTEVYTLNLAYTLDKLLLAAEYTNIETGNDDRSGYLVLADYDVNEKLGLAVRYSQWETDAAGAESEKITFAPNYAITESLGAIIEFSAEEEADGDEIDSFAVELTYTF